MHVIHGLDQADDAGQEEDAVQLPAPGYARSRGDVHVIAEVEHPRHPIAACGVLLIRAELWRRRPGGRLCPGCFGGEAVAAALPRP